MKDTGVSSIVYCERRKIYGIVLDFTHTAFGTAISIKWPEETETTDIYNISPV